MSKKPVATVELMKGWFLEFFGVGDFVIRNPDANGQSQYYEIIPGTYSPVMFEEPILAKELSEDGFVDVAGNPAKPTLKLKGIICKDVVGTNGKKLYRGNLTNFFGKDKGTMTSECHEIVVNGVEYRLYRLCAENKNRILGYIGFYMPTEAHDGRPVQIIEIEDLC